MTRYKKYSSLFLIGLLFSNPLAADAACQQPLDFNTAVQRALQYSLSLTIAHSNIQDKQGQTTQARLYPNPEFSYDMEDPGDNGTWRGLKSREDRYAISQFVELGGKRQKRIQAASYQYYAALVGYEASKLEILNRLSKLFIRVAAAQELIKLAKDQQHIAQEVLRITTGKLESGKVSSIQQNKAKVATAMADLDLKQAEAEWKMAKKSLALLWSATCPDFDSVTYPFFTISAPIPLEECLSKLCQQPEVMRSLYEYYAAYHNLRLEKSARIPDVTFTLGYKRETGEQGVIAAVSLPLPIFDRNQGNIKRAHAELNKTNDLSQQLVLLLENKLSNAYVELERAYQEAEHLQQVVLQSANEALILAQEGYREGKFEHLDVLDAQRTLYDVRGRYIQALVNYHERRADIDYLNSQTD